MLDELQKKIDDFTVSMDKITDLQVKICELTDPPSESEPLSYLVWCSLKLATIPHMVSDPHAAILRSLKTQVMNLFIEVSKKDVAMNNCLKRCR